MEEEDFLAYLDKKHSNIVREKNKERFIEYTEIFTRDIEVGKKNKFYFAKQNKTRIILRHDDIWVDLTDADLINIIIGFEAGTFNQFMKDLSLGLNNKWSTFNFKLDDRAYHGKGIGYSNYGNDTIYLPMDFDITLKELIFIINLIICKDIIGQKYVKKYKKKGVLIQKTVIKYISLSLYYRNGDANAKAYLESIHYPLCEMECFLQQKTSMKKYDDKFVLQGFDKLLKV